ncbi:hypothetical protein CRE_17029 [Caenorhabditis remanei]|uniref:F-box domain-containing protein n=1 Tax=Caenorhabditis remanei TaxID=31234 RepID=E3N7Y3_CAERE|nr:hypothetical protein CRE_17029 [Caenorhabditis remanei]
MELKDLSADCLERIASKLNAVDLIALASCSQHWTDIVKSCRIPIQHLYVNVIGLSWFARESPGHSRILLGVKPIGRRFVHFFFYVRTEEELEVIREDENTIIKMIGRRKMICQLDETNIKVYTTTPVESFFYVLEYMLELLSGGIHHMMFGHVYPTEDEIVLRVLRLQPVSECHRLTLPSRGHISPNLYQYVLDSTTFYRVVIHCDVDDPFTRDTPTNIRHLDMVYAGWVTLPSLLNMNSETIEMIEPTLTLRDMNAFAKNWLQGDNNKLKRVTIRRCRGFEWTNNEKYELLDGLDSEEWKEATERRERFYEDETSKIDCENGNDFTRSDGALATFQFNDSYLHFLVFKYR